MADLTSLPQEVVKTLKDMLAGKRVERVPDAGKLVSIRSSSLFGPLWIASIFWFKLRLNQLPFFSRGEFMNLSAMVLGRVVDPVKCRSELRTAEWLRRSATDMILGKSGNKWSRDPFYPLLTKLSEHWDELERHLWEGRGSRPKLYLYDITSTYFEGRGGSFGKFSYSRDEKKSNPQVVVALVADESGVPVALRILPGNTKDSSTVIDMAEELKQTFGIEKAVLTMDRGMRTEANIAYLKKNGLDYIMALKHKEAREHLKEQNGKLEWNLFDERSIAEWFEDGKRYVICRNPDAAKRDRYTRERIIQRGEERLEKLRRSANSGRIKDQTKITARAAKIFFQTKTERYFGWKAGKGTLDFWRKNELLDIEENYEGYYVIETTLSESDADKIEIDSAYRNQREIEKVFKSCKDELHLRPNFHISDENIAGHIRLTFLAHMVKKRLELALQKSGINEKGSTFLNRFDGIMLNEVAVAGRTVHVVTELNEKEKKDLSKIGITMPSGTICGSLRKQLDFVK